MASSGLYSFAPDSADLISEAFERCKVDPATLVSRHFTSATMSLNLMFADWATLGVKLFQVDEQTQTLTDGTASYSVASGTLYILEGVIRRSSVDTPVSRITRDQYHAIPNKTTEGLPSMVWHDRSGLTYYLWQVPENSTDVFRYRRLRRIQDAGTGLQTPDVPIWWHEALVAGLAAKLAEKYAPADLEDRLIKKAAAALARAKIADREPGDTNFDFGGPL